MIGVVKTWLRRLRRDQSAVAALQFIVLTPFLVFLFTFATDFGMAMTRSAMLERAVDLESRNVRVGLRAADDYDGIRRGICARTRLISNCLTRVKLEVRAMGYEEWKGLRRDADCESLSTLDVTEPENFDVAGENQLVVIRACAKFEAISPAGGFAQAMLTDGKGGFHRFYQLTATNAYVMEP